MWSDNTSHNWVCFKHTELFTLPLEYSFTFWLSLCFSFSVPLIPCFGSLHSIFWCPFASSPFCFACLQMTRPPDWIRCRSGCRYHSGCVRLLAAIAAWIRVTGSLQLLSWSFALLTLSSTLQLNIRATICCSLAFYWRGISLKKIFFFSSVFPLVFQSLCCFRLSRLACTADMKRINIASFSTDGCKDLC